MLRKIVCITALTVAPAAFALNNCSAVSVTGLDTNPCTVTSPCRTFGAAMTATVADGEIIAVTSGGYGAFTIGQGITISGIPGVHAAITVASGDGITVNTASGKNITLRNLIVLNSASAPAGGNGVRINSRSNVRIIGCTFRGFSTGQGAETFAGNLSIDRSTFMNNSVGIAVGNSTPGGGTVTATITNSQIQGNNVATYSGQDTKTVISHSTVALNGDGIEVESTGAGTFTAILAIDRSNVSENQSDGIYMFTDGTNTATAYISETLFEHTGTPVSLGTGSCTAYSFSNNEFVGVSPTVTPIAMK